MRSADPEGKGRQLGGHPFSRVVLVGFMGSGKSTVGPLLARELGWDFTDLDSAIEEEAGCSIPTLFRSRGEEAFREIEDRVAQRVLLECEVVMASGGGWPCRPTRIKNLTDDTLSIWLRVSPERAIERAGRQGVQRPLLNVADPLGRAKELLAAREPYYQSARWWVDTEAYSVDEVVRHVIDRLRSDPERPLRA